MTDATLRTLKAAHDFAVAHGATCPDDCIFRTSSLRTVQAPTVEEETHMDNYALPDPYAAGIAQLKAASATPLSTFEDEYKASRLAALAASSRRLENHFAATPSPRLTAADLADYRALNSYAAGIKALQAKEAK